MRITYVGPVAPARGGIAQHGGHLIGALREMGHEVDVVSWAAQYPRHLYKRDETDARLEPFPGARASLRWWNPLSWTAAGNVARRADLFVFPWVTPFHAPMQRLMLARAGKTPSVAIVHNPKPHESMPMTRWWTRSVLGRVRGAVVHAESGKRDLAELSGLTNIEVVPMPPLIDVEPSPLPQHPPLKLLFLGFVRRYKGLDIAVDAVAELVKRGHDVRLMVAGEFWEPVESWTARVAQLGLTERVVIEPGFASDDRVRELLAQHHLLVAPYRSATQSGVVPLAFAAARGVVATDVGGLAERVREGQSGTVSTAVEPSAFADAIERAAASLEALSQGAATDAARWRDVAQAVLRAGGF